MDPFDKDRFWAASQSGLWRWEGHPAAGAPGFTLEFPPGAIASGDAVPPLQAAVPAAPGELSSYATDVLVARDPRDRTPISAGSLIPRYLVLYVAIEGVGVFRGRFDRQTSTTQWEKKLALPAPVAGIRRIRIALCDRVPERLYAVMSDGGDAPSDVYRSDDNGEQWNPTAHVFDNQSQPSFHLVLEVSPVDPDFVYTGVVDGFISRTGGVDWNKILDWHDFDKLGDYAQHADQHAAVFDSFERRRLWVAHDGGVGLAPDVQRPARSRGFWRMRSHSICSGQFQDIAIDPTPNRAFMMGGGLQDVGSWLSFGGPTWMHVGWADGAYFAFDPGNPRRYLVSQDRAHNIWVVVAGVPRPTLFNPLLNDLPESVAPLHASGLNRTNILSGTPSPFLPVIAQNPATPAHLIFGWQATPASPAAAQSSTNAGVTLNALAGIAAIAPAGTRCSAACFGPRLAAAGGNVDGWVGFSNGNLARTNNAPVGAWAAPAAPLPWGGAPTQTISSIAVHPTDDRIVAVCTSGSPGRVFITYDRGARWHDLTLRIPSAVAVTPAAPAIPAGQRRQFTATANFAGGTSYDATTAVTWASSAPANANFSAVPGEEGQLITTAAGPTTVTATLNVFGVATSGSTLVTVTAGVAGAPAPLPPAPRKFDLLSLPPSPMASLAFTPAAPFRLFVGTIAGVYVLDVPPAPAAAATIVFSWRPFNQGMPLTLVNDIVNVPGTSMLRAATFGRGIWDCDLAATTRAQHRLLIRQTVIEDGFTNLQVAGGVQTYRRPEPVPFTHDPRLPAGIAALDNVHSFDIRVDAPPFGFFEGRVDGVEFDERLAADTLAPLVRNSIYVQVHNIGREEVPNVKVHLYFRLSPIAAPITGAPVALPAAAGLGQVAEFYLPPSFDPPGGGSPLNGATWTRVAAAQTLRAVGPGAPVVARFDWIPPAALAGQNVALLALCHGPDNLHDPLPAAPVAGPGVSAFILRERRAALRIVPVAPLPRADIFIRGGVDDDGRKNSLAAVTRSPHIIVVQSEPAPPATPSVAFRDLLDLRPQDRLRGGVANHIYVRVHNRGNAVVHAEVELWAVKVNADLTPDFLPANWQLLTPAAPARLDFDIQPNDWALGHVSWTPPDPAPAEAQKSYILIALAKSADNNDPLPVTAAINSADTFRQFLSRQAGSDNVAARAIRWVSS